MYDIYDILTKNEEFENGYENLPEDFYFKDKTHYYNTCKNCIRKSNILNVVQVHHTLKEFCSKIYDFTINNLNEIKKMKLRYPNKLYLNYINNAVDLNSLLVAIKSISRIIDDYEYIFKNGEEVLDESQFRKYTHIEKITKSRLRITSEKVIIDKNIKNQLSQIIKKNIKEEKEIRIAQEDLCAKLEVTLTEYQEKQLSVFEDYIEDSIKEPTKKLFYLLINLSKNELIGEIDRKTLLITTPNLLKIYNRNNEINKISIGNLKNIIISLIDMDLIKKEPIQSKIKLTILDK